MELCINVSRIGEFEANLAKLNRKIKRLFGIENDLTAVYGDRDTKTIMAPDPFGDPEQVVEVDIDVVKIELSGTFIGERVSLKGWRIMGSADYSSEQSEAIMRCNDECDPTLKEMLREKRAHVCEHCNRRVWRNKMLILKHEESGEQKVVGSTCLADFVGWGTPENILWLSDLKSIIAKEWDEDGIVFRREDAKAELVDYLCVARFIIRDRGGWAHGKNADEPTSEFISNAYSFNPKAAYQFREILDKKVTDRDLLDVQEAIKWSKEQALGGNTFHQDLQVYIKDGYVTRPMWSNAFWIVGGWVNMKNKEATQRPILNEHFGNVGDWVDWEDFEVVFTTGFHTQFGYTWVYKLRDKDGRTFLNKSGTPWSYNGDKGRTDIERGHIVRIRGKIQEHTEYEGRLETRLSYVKWEPVGHVDDEQEAKDE